MTRSPLASVFVPLPPVPGFLCPVTVWNSLSDGRGDYRIHLQQHEEGSSGGRSNTVGAFYRDGDGLALVLGTLENPEDRQHLRCVTPVLPEMVL